MNRSNATLQKDSYHDRWSTTGSSASGGKQGGAKTGKRDSGPFAGQANRNQGGGGGKDQASALGHDYLFRESQNVSHSDTILDMAILELDQASSESGASYASA